MASWSCSGQDRSRQATGLASARGEAFAGPPGFRGWSRPDLGEQLIEQPQERDELRGRPICKRREREAVFDGGIVAPRCPDP